MGLSLTYVIQLCLYIRLVAAIPWTPDVDARDPRLDYLSEDERERYKRGKIHSKETYMALALAAEQVGAGIAARVFRDTAAELAGSDFLDELFPSQRHRDWKKEQMEEQRRHREQGHFENMHTQEASQQQQRILVRAVITRVLCEAAPFLYLSITFLALQFDGLDMAGRVKTMLTIMFSFFSCLDKAIKCLRADSKIGLWTRVVGILIILCTVYMAIKLAGIYFCKESHHMSMFACL